MSLLSWLRTSNRAPRDRAKHRPAAPRFRPQLETLEDRQLLSSAGVISAITDLDGRTTVFAIGTNNGVYASSDGGWNPAYANAGFRQVSAALDSQGRAFCYAISIADGSLWEFHVVTISSANLFGGVDVSSGWYGLNDGGVCLQISATRNDECYAIGSDHNVYLYNSSSWGTHGWQALMSPITGAVQISAGVDQWGQDKVYVVEPSSGYVLEDNHDGSAQWLRDSQGYYLHASQVSAGIGNNSTGTDLYYLTTDWTSEPHYFDGRTDTPLYFLGVKQISAGLDESGNRECYAIVYDNSLYTIRSPSDYTYDGGWMTQISGAQNNMVFAVGGSNQIWAFDPDSIWAAEWWGSGNPTSWNSGNWHYWDAISANPFA
jgi:hypothetical protein